MGLRHDCVDGVNTCIDWAYSVRLNLDDQGLHNLKVYKFADLCYEVFCNNFADALRAPYAANNQYTHEDTLKKLYVNAFDGLPPAFFAKRRTIALWMMRFPKDWQSEQGKAAFKIV